MSKVRILSIDGGGIRGIVPGVILSYLEQLLQKKSGTKKRLSHYFDLMAGTSTGGILTCAYLLPGTNNRPKLTAQQAVELYLEWGDEIFDVSLKKRLSSGMGLLDEKYDETALEKVLEKYFGETKLSELLKPCLITGYNIRERKAHFFTQHDADSDVRDYYVKHIARATSAAPTYFEVAHIESLFGSPKPLVDGGVFANNPAMCAYAEARTINFGKVLSNKKPKNPSAKDMVIISLGTGSESEPYHYKEAKDWGMVQWIKPIIDIMMSGNSETVDYQLQQIFKTVEGKGHYFRLKPSLYNASSSMDDAGMDNMRLLEEAGKKSVESYAAQLDRIADLLIEHN